MANVPIELFSVTDGELLAEGLTDANGEYELIVSAESGLAVRLEVSASIETDNFAVLVVDRDRLLYRVASERFALPENGRMGVDLVIDLSSEAPAFNILDVASGGLQFLADVLSEPPALPNLTIIWQEGIASPCRTCFRGTTIDLQGDPDDPDGYDDDIILHEVGHFVQSLLSVDDSPGGSHDGTPTNPLLAYGEGFATFFSCWVRGTDTYQDYRTEGWKFRRHESLVEELHGTTNGRLDGDLSEILVTAIFWDLFDDSPDESHDTLSGNDVWAATLFEMMSERPDRDLGARGIDLADFIEQARCRFDDVAPFQALVEETGFPFDFDLPEACPAEL
jgi:hypothetical protein